MLFFYYGFSTSFVYSGISLQLFLSALCNNYIIYLIYHHSRSVPYNKIISFFKPYSNSDLHVTTYAFSLENTYRTFNPCLRRNKCTRSTFKCLFC